MKIISKSIDSLTFHDLVNYFVYCLDESMSAVSDSKEHLAWYKDCEIEDYFTEMQELWTDNDERLGEGFNIISAKIIYNEDTAADCKAAFLQARDQVIKDYIN